MVLIFATSRWGTNIGVMPLFVTDVLLGLAILHFLISVQSRADRRPQIVWPGLFFGLFFTYACARIFASAGKAGVVDWARDSAPFVYVGVALLSAASFAHSTRESRHATFVILWRALIVHLVWAMVAHNTIGRFGISVPLPFFRAEPFSLRHDFDGALIGLLAALALWKLLATSGRKLVASVVLATSLVAIVQMPSRAALLSTVAALAFVYLLALVTNEATRTRQALLVAALPMILMAAFAAMVSTIPGRRLLATFLPALAQSAEELNALGTTSARTIAWQQVIDWTNASTVRMLFGGGFGNDFLTESGAVVVISGTEYEGVRSPHNYFVGAYARLGIIGTALTVLLLLYILQTIVRRRAAIAREPFLVLCAVTMIAMIPVATLGVILESPFGAIPFYWCAGIILALRKGDQSADTLLQSEELRQPSHPTRRGTLVTSTRTR